MITIKQLILKNQRVERTHSTRVRTPGGSCYHKCADRRLVPLAQQLLSGEGLYIMYSGAHLVHGVKNIVVSISGVCAAGRVCEPCM